LVQVTVLPARTVSVAGTKAKLSMLTASPATGAADPVADAEGPAEGPDIDGMPPMPGIPGVAPDPKVADGCDVCGGGDEHAANSSTASSTTRTPRSRSGIRVDLSIVGRQTSTANR
jgi:hypothetical protein